MEGKLGGDWLRLVRDTNNGQGASYLFHYGDHPDQIGHMTGSHYWAAMREIYSHAYDALDGGYMALALKDHIRDRKRVHTCDQTVALCEQLGFRLGERHARKVQPLSLWQQLNKQKGEPVVEEEDVLAFVKGGGCGMTWDGADLRCVDAGALVAELSASSADLVHLDPPWPYDNKRFDYYDLLSFETIRAHMEATYRVAKPDSYLICWATFPTLGGWMGAWEVAHGGKSKDDNWQYVTGATWGKMGMLGTGTHFRGNAEPILLYKKGSPRPLTTQRNLILCKRPGEHSEKPQSALRPLVEMCCPPGGLALDLYAGSTASLMRACRATGRRYVGAEISRERYEQALVRYGLDEQSAMVLFGS